MNLFCHTETCKQWRVIQEREEAAFRHAHPMFCRACHGWGVWSGSFDPSPSGVSLSSGTMTDSGPCTVCVEEGICPWCMGPLNEEGTACLQCGWVEGNGGISEEEECDCYERWLDNNVHDTISEM